MANNYDSAVRIVQEMFKDRERGLSYAGPRRQSEQIVSALDEVGLLAEDEGILTLRLPAEEIARMDWHTVSVLTQGRGVLLIPTDGEDK